MAKDTATKSNGKWKVTRRGMLGGTASTALIGAGAAALTGTGVPVVQKAAAQTQVECPR